MASQKTTIIESLFNDASRWDGKKLVRSIVTLVEVQAAIDAHNAKPDAKAISPKNPANFFKDFVRKIKSAEKNWPASVLRAGFTGVQRTGKGDSFAFVPLPAGQATAFAATSAVYPKNPATAKFAVAQTLSLAVMTKVLARSDENWLQSVAVALHLPQAHLAIHPNPALDFVEVGHMQSNVKLRKTKIDGLYFGRLANGRVALVTMEVKGLSDDVLESQVMEQIEAVQNMKAVKSLLAAMNATEADTVIFPMAMKLVSVEGASGVPGLKEFAAVGRKFLYMADYGPVPFMGKRPPLLTPFGETLFDMRPPIAGINK